MAEDLNAQMYRMIPIYLSILLTQVAHYTLSLGTIVQKSTDIEGFHGTATIIGIQATASLLALGLSILYKKNNIFSNRLPLAIPIFWLGSSICLFELDVFSGIWLSMLLIRITSSFWITSFLLASIPNFAKDDSLKANKIAHYFLIMGGIVGCSIGPVVVSEYGLKIVSALDISLVTLTCLLIWRSGLLKVHSHLEYLQDESESAETPLKEVSNKYFMHVVYYIATTTCLLTGIFSVVEVPILKERFSASAEIISSVYISTMLLNMLGMKLCPTLQSPRTLLVAYAISAFGMILTTSTYLFSYDWLLLAFSIIIFGLSNGVYNIAQSNIVQLVKLQSQRLKVFLLFRFIGQSTLFFSVALPYLVHDDMVPYVILVFSIILLSPFVCLIKFVPK